MAIPFKSSVDFSKNQIINVVLHNAAAPPANPKAGQFYYNTADKSIYYYDGTAWINLGSLIAPGDGLVHSDANNIRTLNVNVDNATIEINADVVRVKDGGISTPKLADGAVTTIKITDKNITFAKIQDLPVMTVIGSLTGGTPQAIAILNESDFASNSATALATQASIKAYVDSNIAGIGTLVGGFDAAANTNLPGGATIKKGAYWYVTTAGTVQGQILNIGDLIIANQANPTVTNANHYIFLESNRSQATTTILGLVMLATAAEVQAGTDANKAVTPATLSARTATETRTGLAEIATQAETDAGTDDTRIVTPLKLKAWYDAKAGGYVASIGNGTNVTFTVTHGLGSRDTQVEVYDNGTGTTTMVEITRASTSPFDITITFGADNVPTANQYRVVVRKVA